MTIQQLRYFLALCEDLNYSRAAARLYLSRQALRQSIAALEQELCGALFSNRRNRLALTHRGEQLRALAAPVVKQFDAMCAKAYSALVTHPPVRLGVSNALVPDFLPSLGDYLADFRRSYPGIPLEHVALDNSEVAARLAAGELDAGLVMDTGEAPPALARACLSEHEFAVLVARGSPLWGRQGLGPRELDGSCLLVPSVEDWFLSPLRRCFDAAGSSVRFDFAASFYQVVYAARERGAVGITRAARTQVSETDPLRDIILTGAPPLCAAFLTPAGSPDACLDLLCRTLQQKLKQRL